MRLKILLDNPQETVLPINYQEFLTSAIYRLLGSSDAEYARFLHDKGYAADDGPKRFKLFVFSNLRAERRRVEGDRLRLGVGAIEWFVSSPVEAFLTHCATGLLTTGQLQVGPATFSIAHVETLPTPDFSSGQARFVCLSPIVAGVPEAQGTHYLRPNEGEKFSEAVRRNLARKWELVTGSPAAAEPFRLEFDAGYLERSRGGTKKISYKGIEIIGAFCPFRVSGSSGLIRVGYECGFGEKNAGGFGMAETVA